MTLAASELAARYREHVDRALGHAGALGLGERLTSLVESSNRQEFRVSVLGRFKAGKSSVINALVGCKTVPVHRCSCTSALVEICRGPTLCFLGPSKGGGPHTPVSREIFMETVGGAARAQTGGLEIWRVTVPSDAIPPGIILGRLHQNA